MTTALKRIAHQGAMTAAAALFLAGIGYTFAAPTAPPPGSTLPLPINVGSTAQTKTGALTVQGLLTASGGLTASGTVNLGTTPIATLNVTNLCLNGTCKSAWPSGGSQTTTVNGAGYYNNGSQFYTMNTYESFTYYSYGSQYTNYTYNTGAYSVSLVVPSTIPSGAVPSAVLSGTLWCHAGPYNYNGYSPASSYVNDSYYYWRTAGTISSITNNNNGTVTINGTCKFTTAQSYYYAYGGMSASNVTFLYN